MKFVFWIFIFISVPSYAAEQPHINEIKKKMAEDGKLEQKSSENYSQKIKNKLEPQKTDSTDYSSRLKQKLESESATPSTEGYTDQIKTKLEPKQEGGAIDAVKEGKSELELKRPGKIKAGFSARIGSYKLSHNVKSSKLSTGRKFSDIYGKGWNPDVSLMGEWKPFYSEWLGSLGLVASIGFASFRGNGLFEYELTNPVSGQTFGTGSKVQFSFMYFPISVGASYRFNLLRILRPYVIAGPSLVIYRESRNDGKPDSRGYSSGLFYTAGVGLLLDWISSKSSWNLYDVAGIKHFYIFTEYSRLNTLSGSVQFASSGFYSGLAFEF